jgi:choice-of-anchor A domain-containing protein
MKVATIFVVLCFLVALVNAQGGSTVGQGKCIENLNKKCEDNPNNAYMVCIPPDFVPKVKAALPESKKVDQSLLDPKKWDPDVHFDFSNESAISGRPLDSFEGWINVTLFFEGAGYRNAFGYYVYTYDSKGNAKVTRAGRALWKNVSLPPDGCLQAGVTTDFGPFKHGEHVGWIVFPDKANGKNYTPYYSQVNLNPNDEVHFFVFSIDQYYIIGIEDLPLKSSDLDYNDVVFQFTTTKGALPVNVPVLDCPECKPGQGQCNKETKKCDCFSLPQVTYYGDQCENSYTCDGCEQGVCVGPNQCQCNLEKFNPDCRSCVAGRVKYPDCQTCDKYCDVKKGYTCDALGNCIPPPPPPEPAPVCSTQPFGDASDYSVFVRGNIDGQSSDVQGRIAAGDSITLVQYSIAEALNPTDDDTFGCDRLTGNGFAAVAGKNFKWENGNARVGSIAVGGSDNIGIGVESGLAPQCSVQRGVSPINFVESFRYLGGLAASFAGQTANGKTGLNQGSKAILYFTPPKEANKDGFIVFDVSASDLETADAVAFEKFDGLVFKAIIINIQHNSRSWKWEETSFETLISGAHVGISNKIIWNFADSSISELTINAIAIPGTILAPSTNVHGDNGVLWGAIYANSFEGSLQVNVPTQPGPCIMTNYKFDRKDAPCPPCGPNTEKTGDSSNNCKCVCTDSGFSGCPENQVPDPYGGCACGCPFNPLCVLGQDPDSCACIGLSTDNKTCSSNPLPGWLFDFQIVTEGDLTLKSTRTGGRIASGGNTLLRRIAIGDRIAANKKEPTCEETNGQYLQGVVLSRGVLDFTSGKPYGNIFAQKWCKIAGYLQDYKSVAGCFTPRDLTAADLAGGNFDFTAAFTALRAYSEALSDPKRTPATGQALYAFDVLTLYGYGGDLEVFRVSAGDLAKSRRIDVTGVSRTATIIIDIQGGAKDDVKISDSGLAALAPFARTLLWNSRAEKFSFKNVALPGLILAPWATIEKPVGVLLGGAFVKQLTAKGDIGFEWPFKVWGGCLPDAFSLPNFCSECAPGTRRLDVTSCACEDVLTVVPTSISHFPGEGGAVVTFTLKPVGRTPTVVTLNFPNSAPCPLQKAKQGNGVNVFTVNPVSNPSGFSGLTFQTPRYAGFTADNFSFVAVFEGAGDGACSTIPVPTIVAVDYEPLR